MRVGSILLAFSFLSLLAFAPNAPAQERQRSPATRLVRLEDLNLSHMHQGYGSPQIDRSVRNKPLTLAGKVYEHGVGTHAASRLWIDLARGSERFQAWVGVDDSANGPGTVVFRIYVDGKRAFDSGVMKPTEPAKEIDLNLSGARSMVLIVDDANDGISFDHADWAEARFVVSGYSPKASEPPETPAVVLTPKPPNTPRINGPRLFGVRPGSPFLFRIPATGKRPMVFGADNLPAGLSLDTQTGIITGQITGPGEYLLTLHAINSLGSSQRDFKIVCGEKIALTPHMGWNHWYAWTRRVTDQTIRQAADAIIANGMADHGYSYVNIDDCWAVHEKSDDPLRGGVPRDEQGRILPNKCFPDMKALTDYIHSKGLKAGIYTSPGPITCARYEGSYLHEEQDVKQFVDWGFDFLKYDWCSYGRIAPKPNRADAMKPYKMMGDILKKQPRDIVLNLCQYGMRDVWEWGHEVGGHSWRTSGDLGEIGVTGAPGKLYTEVMDLYARRELHKYAGPDSWNDPDYLLLGYLAHGNESVPTTLTPNEQYTQVSLWCLLAAPLIYSGDISRLDDFALSLLCNDEVIEVDQDPLGQGAHRVSHNEQGDVWTKQMQDGSTIVGLFNRDEVDAPVTARWADVGLVGPHVARDLWAQKDLGTFDEQFACILPRHGVKLIRLHSLVSKAAP